MDTPDGRWFDLVADLSALVDAQETAESDARIAELTRAEHATIGFADRLRAAVGAEVVVDLADGEPVRGIVADAAAAWLLVRAATREPAEHLVPLAAVDGIAGLGPAAAPAAGREPTLTQRLRILQQDRRVVLVRTRARPYRGRIARVGSDHLDLDVLDGPGPQARVVPLAALLCVSLAPAGLEL